MKRPLAVAIVAWVYFMIRQAITRAIADQSRTIRIRRKEEKVIRLRFGIGCEREHTLEEIGQEFTSRASASGKSKPKPCGSFARQSVCGG